MPSLAPLTGTPAQIFSSRQSISASIAAFSLGHLVASQAPELSTFLAVEASPALVRLAYWRWGLCWRWG